MKLMPMTLRPRLAAKRPASHGRGFTLVEILIVVVILGILAAMIIPQFASATTQSRQSVFASNLKELTKAAELFKLENNAWPEDASSGSTPTGMENHIHAGNFESATPIGGVWDFEYQDSGGVTSAVGVHFNGTGETRGDAFMNEVDSLLDDGDVTTGRFRRLEANRYYFVIQE